MLTTSKKGKPDTPEASALTVMAAIKSVRHSAGYSHKKAVISTMHRYEAVRIPAEERYTGNLYGKARTLAATRICGSIQPPWAMAGSSPITVFEAPSREAKPASTTEVLRKPSPVDARNPLSTPQR